MTGLSAARISGHSRFSLALSAAVGGASIAFLAKAAQQEAPSSGPKWRISAASSRRVGESTGAVPASIASCRRAMVRAVTAICSPWKEGARPDRPACRCNG